MSIYVTCIVACLQQTYTRWADFSLYLKYGNLTGHSSAGRHPRERDQRARVRANYSKRRSASGPRPRIGGQATPVRQGSWRLRSKPWMSTRRASSPLRSQLILISSTWPRRTSASISCASARWNNIQGPRVNLWRRPSPHSRRMESHPSRCRLCWMPCRSSWC